MGTALRALLVVTALGLAGCGATHAAKPFAGSWVGHTRTLTIGADGRGTEVVDDGCCMNVIHMRLRITDVDGATASYVVVSVEHAVGTLIHPVPKAGDRGTLLLSHGAVTDQLTDVTFCGPNVGRCGA